jgi:transposase InsO family protein
VCQFYWPGITNDVRCFVWNYYLCGSNKVWRKWKHSLLKPLPIPKQKWQEISINFIIKLPLSEGCKNLAIITDYLGKGIIIEPMEKINAEATARIFIKTFYQYHGLPTAIISDQGSAFMGALWTQICHLLRIIWWLLTAYYPKTDGIIEQINAEVEAYLCMFIDRLQGD